MSLKSTTADPLQVNHHPDDLFSKDVLVVDDDHNICTLISRWLTKAGYAVNLAFNAQQALDLLEQKPIALMLTDINMPGKTGIELIEITHTKYSKMAAVMMTAEDDRSIAMRALELGSYGYIIKPIDKNELLISVAYAMRMRATVLQNRLFSNEMERLVAERNQELLRKRDELIKSQAETIQCLARIAEFRDKDTAQHTIRMSHYCWMLAQKAELPSDLCDLLVSASPLHDIGKIGIPDKILLKPSKLTAEEFEQIKKHSEMGDIILDDSSSEVMKLAAVIARTHHEKYDGSGYPNGLAGEEIPIVGRIVAICDVFDALTSDRVYKEAYPFEKALSIMLEEKGKHFDPQLLDLFIEALEEVQGQHQKLRHQITADYKKQEKASSNHEQTEKGPTLGHVSAISRTGCADHRLEDAGARVQNLYLTHYESLWGGSDKTIRNKAMEV